MALKLPRLLSSLSIVNKDGKPSDFFLRLFNVDFAQRIEQNEAAQEQTIQDLADIVAQIQAANEASQQAQQTANQAQETADAAVGGTAVSGSASDPAIDLLDAAWVEGPQVDLIGVSAGDLTITGSGPQQDSDVILEGEVARMNCQFRIMEIVSGVDTLVFTGSFRVDRTRDVGSATVTNLSSSDTSAFSLARTSTGAVSYRIDAKGTGVSQVFSLLLYVYARRA